MADSYFTNPGDLSSSDNFRRAGDLGGFVNKRGNAVPKKEVKNNLYVKSFRNTSDYGDSFFKSGGNLPSYGRISNNAENGGLTEKDINDYLLTVVSGKKYSYECELGTLCAGGCKIVNFTELKQMVEDGYNIVRANVIRVNMIEVEFQQFRKIDNRERRR